MKTLALVVLAVVGLAVAAVVVHELSVTTEYPIVNWVRVIGAVDDGRVYDSSLAQTLSSKYAVWVIKDAFGNVKWYLVLPPRPDVNWVTVKYKDGDCTEYLIVIRVDYPDNEVAFFTVPAAEYDWVLQTSEIRKGHEAGQGGAFYIRDKAYLVILLYRKTYYNGRCRVPIYGNISVKIPYYEMNGLYDSRPAPTGYEVVNIDTVPPYDLEATNYKDAITKAINHFGDQIEETTQTTTTATTAIEESTTAPATTTESTTAPPAAVPPPPEPTIIERIAEIFRNIVEWLRSIFGFS